MYGGGRKDFCPWMGAWSEIVSFTEILPVTSTDFSRQRLQVLIISNTLHTSYYEGDLPSPASDWGKEKKTCVVSAQYIPASPGLTNMGAQIWVSIFWTLGIAFVSYLLLSFKLAAFHFFSLLFLVQLIFHWNHQNYDHWYQSDQDFIHHRIIE